MSVDSTGAVPAAETVDVLVVGAGQAGLAAGRAAQAAGLSCLVVEARDEVGGSWPDYYDSLRLFSPARFSALPGLAMPGPAGRYPTRDEMTRYLRAYAERFEVPVRTETRVVSVARDGALFAATTAAGQLLVGRSLVAASGGFGRPSWPALPGASRFTGRLLHAASYRRPDPFAGRRMVVVGRGNSAVQIATELAELADVTLAVRRPLRLRNQRPLGVDVHHWSRWTGLDRLPVGTRGTRSVGVLDDGRHATALAAGRPTVRAMFTRLTPAGVLWSDGTEEPVDVVLLATGYHPDLTYLAGTGALDELGRPMHCQGVSTTVPELGFVGLPGQTGFASATVRGVGPDARRVIRRLRRQLTDPLPRPLACRVPALAQP
jgi:putative flavoprotein involved in K+ transport